MTITLFWPQITYIILLVLTGLFVAVNHGKPKPDYNIGYWLFDATVAVTLLIFGGFFGK